ncbi:MAG TPA: glycosyltransferase family 39 protein [Candidatus Baltobacteraceae bacterium]|nr:glycosyltransferase family 39 protein [Candidatus Baltobacteraceae bacterium]
MADVTIAVHTQRAQARTIVLALFALAFAFGIAGIFVRAHGYAGRLLWTDEAITAMRVSGQQGAQFIAAAVDGRPHSVEEIRRFAGIGAPAPMGEVVRSLAVEDSQHPPLYYVVTGAWTRAFGFSIATLRAPALLFGILVPFAVGWMCFELYSTRAAAALGFALASVSPVLVLYSQEAREYGLWALFVAVATAAVLRAVRKDDARWWIVYGACCIAGMYADVLFATVLLSHGIYVALRVRGRPRVRFVLCLAAAALAFAPWAVEILKHQRAIDLSNAWTAGPWPLRMLLEKWAFNIGTTFFDLEYAKPSLALVLVPIAALIAAAVWWNSAVLRGAARTMIVALLAVPVVTLMLPDLVLQSHRSSVTRYEMALWIALLVAVAGFLASRLRRKTGTGLWLSVTGALLIVMSLSSAIGANSRVWWDNRQDAPNIAIAHVLSENPSSVLVVPGRWARLLALSFYLAPSVSVEMLPPHAAAARPAGFGSAYLLGREAEARAAHGRLARVAFPDTGGLNAQVRSFRGGADTDELMLWRFEP